MVDLNLRRTLFGGNDIAIDLGTANTLIYVKGVGVVVDEPTLLAVNKSDNSIITIGEEAKKLIGRVPETIELIRPKNLLKLFYQEQLVELTQGQELLYVFQMVLQVLSKGQLKQQHMLRARLKSSQ